MCFPRWVVWFKNLEAMVHRRLIPASLLGSVCALWLWTSISARPNIKSTVKVGVTWTTNRQKFGLEVLCCCCRGEKSRRCKQTNTTHPQATILNRKAGLNPVQNSKLYTNEIYSNTDKQNIDQTYLYFIGIASKWYDIMKWYRFLFGSIYLATMNFLSYMQTSEMNTRLN